MARPTEAECSCGKMWLCLIEVVFWASIAVHMETFEDHHITLVFPKDQLP